MTVMRAVPRGCGHCLPARVVENAEFEKSLDTSDEWIRTRTGIEQRHIAADGQYTSDLAVGAAREAMAAAGVGPEDIDFIVVGTTTPDRVFPNVGCLVEHGKFDVVALGDDVDDACRALDALQARLGAE